MTVMTNEDPADPSAHEPKPVYVVWAESGNCIMWTTNKAQATECAEKHQRPMRTLYDQDVVAHQAEEIAELRAQVSAWRRQCDTLTHQVICCGVAASHPDATLTTRGAYAGKWNSAQAEQVRKLRAERDALSRQLDQIIEG